MGKIGFAAGAVVGSVIGAAVGAMMVPVMDKKNKKIKKTAGRAFKNLGSVIDGILEMDFK